MINSFKIKSVALVFAVFVFSSSVFSQVSKDSIKEKYKIFVKKLTKDGGTWHAENPKYDPSNSEDFKVFILKVWQQDPLKIDANISGINTKNDTIGFWKFSEFYAPDKQKNIFYQRSIDGTYYASGLASMTETERYCEMSFYYSGGKYMKHKDLHTFIDDNKIRSVSYDYDPKSESWINESILIWKR